jgi:16S rRNA (adenine1518-N6/adenine1519-N6)-dimethyltransferase
MKTTRRHSLGQHFLADKGTLRKIILLIQPQPEDFIIEIGGGKGALTRPLAEQAGKVVSIEKDPEMVPFLEGIGMENLRVIQGDALKMDFTALAESPRTKIAGNLPYSISSPLLFKVVDERKNISSCVFLIQKEFALRVCAEPGTKTYAPLSILAHTYFERKLRFTVKPGAFSPPPKVDSAVISLVKREKPLLGLADEGNFLTFLRWCFSQRRKKLANNLRAAGFSRDRVEESLSQAGIFPEARAEQLAPRQFYDLMTALSPEET